MHYNFIAEHNSRKKSRRQLISQLVPAEQEYWYQFLKETDRLEENFARRIRRYETSLESTTSPLGMELLILIPDTSPNPLEALIEIEENSVLQLLLTTLQEILANLAPEDKALLLFYYSSDNAPSWRSIGRELKIDYRRAQRRLPKLLKIIKNELIEKLQKS